MCIFYKVVNYDIRHLASWVKMGAALGNEKTANVKNMYIAVQGDKKCHGTQQNVITPHNVILNEEKHRKLTRLRDQKVAGSNPVTSTINPHSF